MKRCRWQAQAITLVSIALGWGVPSSPMQIPSKGRPRPIRPSRPLGKVPTSQGKVLEGVYPEITLDLTRLKMTTRPHQKDEVKNNLLWGPVAPRPGTPGDRRLGTLRLN